MRSTTPYHSKQDTKYDSPPHGYFEMDLACGCEMILVCYTGKLVGIVPYRLRGKWSCVHSLIYTLQLAYEACHAFQDPCIPRSCSTLILMESILWKSPTPTEIDLAITIHSFWDSRLPINFSNLVRWWGKPLSNKSWIGLVVNRTANDSRLSNARSRGDVTAAAAAVGPCLS